MVISVEMCSCAPMNKTILTITGSDGTGGSGVQADIRLISKLGGTAASAITSITVQNTLGIQEFHDLPASVVRQQVEAIMETLNSLNIVVFVMIFCAGLLAVVVLYNLTNINIAERVREIATIKVLGFYSLETANYIYRENIVLTIVGGVVGLFLGNLFTGFIISSIQMNNVHFPTIVEPLSYVWGFLLTLVFSMLVNFIMYFKMNKISMVESLKSIE